MTIKTTLLYKAICGASGRIYQRLYVFRPYLWLNHQRSPVGLVITRGFVGILCTLHVAEENPDSDDETDAEICQVDGMRATRETRRAVQTEAGKQIEEANRDLDALREMLTNDTAVGGDVMAAIMEQPVSIVEFFQKKDKDGKLQECPDGKGWEKRDIGDIMDLIDESWAEKIRVACRDKVENDNNVRVEDEHGVNRMAAYMTHHMGGDT